MTIADLVERIPYARLIGMQEKFVDSGEIDRETGTALAIEDDDALDKHLTDRFGDTYRAYTQKVRRYL